MDLGISGKKAIVCASSKGLGLGCAIALGNAGVDLTMCARNYDTLAQVADDIRGSGVKVETVACDITSLEGINKVLELTPNPDILINNAGGPPPGMWQDWTRTDFINAINANMLTAITLMQKVLPLMIKKKMGSDCEYH